MSFEVTTKTIFFDESGNTGPKLLDPTQRFFSVASTDLNQDEAREIIETCFPSRASPDLKFKTLIANWRNFDGLIKFARLIGNDPSRSFCFVVNKRFALLCRLVDWLVEPFWHARGFDFYLNDYARSYVNLFDLAFQVDGSEQAQTEITDTFERFVDAPSKLLLQQMQQQYRGFATGGSKNVSRFMQHVADGADEFEKYWDVEGFQDSNDIHVTSVVTSIAWWRSQHSMDFDVVHDESNHFFDRQDLWALVTDMSASEAKVMVGKKSIQFPLCVRKTTPGVSASLYSLKICDLIAGFHTKSKSHIATKEQRKFMSLMLQEGMGSLNSDCIDRGDNFATAMPAKASGLDAVDQIAKSIYKTKA